MEKFTRPWNANQLAAQYRNGTMVFDNAIQRGFVWKIPRRSLFIDSLIRGFVVPPIYAIETGRKIWSEKKKKEVAVFDCIDGKQRCMTLALFINDEFALSGLKPIILPDGTEYELNGKKFSDLDEEYQDAIKAYSIVIYSFSDITDEEVAEQMSRLNNGQPLTGVENARIKAKNLDGIIYLAKNDLFTSNLTEKAIEGYQNEDIVMKLALQTKGDTDLSNKNVREAYETYEFGYDDTSAIKNTLDYVHRTIDLVKQDAEDKENKNITKRLVTRLVSKTNLIAILYAAYRMKNKQTETDLSGVTEEQFAKIIEDFFNNGKNTVSEEYNEACLNGTMRSTNVETRNEALMDYIEQNAA